MKELETLLKNIDTLDKEKLNLIKNKFSDFLLNNSLNEEIDNLKINIIENDLIDFKEENILHKIKNILNNIPKNTTPKEKVRYIYLQLGNLFSYDYRVAYDISHVTNKIVDFNNFIGKYQTCIQISNILNEILNSLENVESKIIARKLDNIRGNYGHDHLANEVRIKIDDETYETYLLDLTLDLFLIQSDCKTKHFGYETSIDKDYDIIPQIDNKEMDEKLGLNINYTDDIIKKIKTDFNNITSNNFENVFIYKLSVINSLMKKYQGYHEAKQFINLLFNELLDSNYKEFNIYKRNEFDEITNFKTIYKIENKNFTKWIIYSNTLGFIQVNDIILKNLLENNWITKSTNLLDEIMENKKLI